MVKDYEKTLSLSTDHPDPSEDHPEPLLTLPASNSDDPDPDARIHTCTVQQE